MFDCRDIIENAKEIEKVCWIIYCAFLMQGHSHEVSITLINRIIDGSAAASSDLKDAIKEWEKIKGRTE